MDKIDVLCWTILDFNQWVRRYSMPNEEYFPIKGIQDIGETYFNGVRETYLAKDNNSYSITKEAVELRIKKK